MDGTARIVIIGNGFDLHYNIASSYRHYKEWLTIVHPELWQKLERYINANGEWWNDFERNLAEFDIRKIIKESPRYYPSRNSRFPPSPLFLANQFFEKIRKEITDSFVEWIKTLSINDVIKNVELPEAVKSNFFFSNFKKFSFQQISAFCIQHKVGHFCGSL